MAIALIGLGIFCALVACMPSAYLFECAQKDENCSTIFMGLAGVIWSYVFLCMAMAIVKMLVATQFLAFAFAVVVTFLVFWGIESARAFRLFFGQAESHRRGES